ncbi:hypothetical protein Ani05nite_74490 [Amorphoplanes nipponensis]|uniref:NB-ARC domain-containing protein n=2 Tax=Actinoplanes nipponensis TaxID=135950 RepID=A0A919MXZ4_9ACTN|nr:hypothetical protein Ani05nite_74490 [Actinoplanes nipponensis]
MARRSETPRDPQSILRLQLRLCREHNGQPPLRLMAERTKDEDIGHSYSHTTIGKKLEGNAPIDWIFVQAMVRVLHRLGGHPGEPDLARWLKLFEQTLRHDHWVGSPPPLADAYQSRPLADELSLEVARGRTVVLRGFGGVGKTQFAADLVYRSWTEHLVDVVVWVDAADRAAPLAALSKLAGKLGIEADGDEEVLARQVLARLAERGGHRALIVYDGVRNPADLDGLWPLPGDTATVVTTQCRQDALEGHGRIVHTVGVFEPGESLGYLREKLDGEGLEDAARLAEELGHLPLALSLAGAYMKNYALDCPEYLRRFRELRLVDLSPDRDAATLATAWNLAITAADERRPEGAARLLLQFAANLDPHGSPAALFLTEAVRAMLTARRGRATSADDARDGVSNLRLLSLCEDLDGHRTITVHPLLQRSVREDAPAAVCALAGCAADALLERWPTVEGDVGLVEQLRNNTEALRRNADDALWRNGLHRVVFRAGNSLTAQGLPVTALRYWQELVPSAVKHLGAEHADTLTVRHNLAWARHRTGDHAGALDEMRDVWEIRRRVLPAEDLNTLAALHGITVFQQALGNREGAAASLAALVTRYDRRVGADDRDTLNARKDLACMLGELESPAVAVSRLRALVDRYRTVVGVDDPDTLDVELVLAGWLAGTGELDEARSLVDRLIGDYRRVLGADHLTTLQVRYYAADVRRQQGQRRQAGRAMRGLRRELQPLLGAGRPELAELDDEIDGWLAELHLRRRAAAAPARGGTPS